MLNYEEYRKINDLYFEAAKVFGYFYEKETVMIADPDSVPDPFILFITDQLGAVVNILSSSFNFSKDLEDRLTILSDRSSKKD